MQEHFGKSMNLARIKLMALLIHANEGVPSDIKFTSALSIDNHILNLQMITKTIHLSS